MINNQIFKGYSVSHLRKRHRSKLDQTFYSVEFEQCIEMISWKDPFQKVKDLDRTSATYFREIKTPEGKYMTFG